MFDSRTARMLLGERRGHFPSGRRSTQEAPRSNNGLFAEPRNSDGVSSALSSEIATTIVLPLQGWAESTSAPDRHIAIYPKAEQRQLAEMYASSGKSVGDGGLRDAWRSH
jgi:hypothetical protein